MSDEGAPATPRLCGYDVHEIGDRSFEPVGVRSPACRLEACFVVPDWEEDFDLFLCARHAQAVAKLHDLIIEALPRGIV